ncbi:hypothetical protein CJU35_05590 [Pseudomonas aeruginosa]|nr:hypothetical protein [Pseudomonas aeruginosa]PBV09325.1 hypothetical protein CJU35_05590 [Pseudomonas aeruginosa]
MPNHNPESLELKAGAVFEYGSRTYRLDAFLCEVEDKTPAHPFIARLVAELNAEEDAKIPAGHRRIKLRFCLPEEATYVAGSGVCGCVAAIADIAIVGTVPWSSRELYEHQEEALRLGREGLRCDPIVRPIRQEACA